MPHLAPLSLRTPGRLFEHAMSIQGSSIHPKLIDAAMAELWILSTLRGKSMQAIAEDLLHRALLGESYAFNLATEEAERMGKVGNRR